MGRTHLEPSELQDPSLESLLFCLTMTANLGLTSAGKTSTLRCTPVEREGAPKGPPRPPPPRSHSNG